MPTVAESGLPLNGDFDLRLASTESWTDALPSCQQTGVGTQTNQMYRRNGGRQEFHSCEDRNFHFCVNSTANGDLWFYGLFDGHEGQNAANFVYEHLPAEIILGQTLNGLTEERVRALYQTAFSSVDREYFQSIADLLAERTQLALQIQGMSTLEAYREFPEIVERLKTVTSEVSAGTAAVVALICNNGLHVANVGDSKAILCRTDPLKPYEFKAYQLTTDHDLNNPSELERLSSLGLDIDLLKQNQMIGNISITRCFGNYLVKGAYNEFPELSSAKDEPVIAEPSIKSIVLDEHCQFLILASGSVFRTLAEATGSHQVNTDLVRMVAEEFKVQTTLTGVAQAVVNKIGRIHQDEYLREMNDPNLPQSRKQIEDLTLMVRNFRHPLVRSLSGSSSNSRSPSVSSMQRQFSDQLRISIEEEEEPLDEDSPFRDRSASKTLMVVPGLHSNANTVVDNRIVDRYEDRNDGSTTTTTTTNSTEFEDNRFATQRADPLDLDEEGKIAAYVSFDQFYEAVRTAQSNGQTIGFAID